MGAGGLVRHFVLEYLRSFRVINFMFHYCQVTWLINHLFGEKTQKLNY